MSVTIDPAISILAAHTSLGHAKYRDQVEGGVTSRWQAAVAFEKAASLQKGRHAEIVAAQSLDLLSTESHYAFLKQFKGCPPADASSLDQMIETARNEFDKAAGSFLQQAKLSTQTTPQERSSLRIVYDEDIKAARQKDQKPHFKSNGFISSREEAAQAMVRMASAPRYQLARDAFDASVELLGAEKTQKFLFSKKIHTLATTARIQETRRRFDLTAKKFLEAESSGKFNKPDVKVAVPAWGGAKARVQSTTDRAGEI